MKIDNLINIVNDLLLNSIGVLRDEDYQRKIWFQRKGPAVSTYIDTAVHFFDRSELIFNDSLSINQLGNENYSLLKKLYDLLKEHVDLTEDRTNVDELRENEILDDPNWHDIQSLADELYVKLNKFVKRYSHE